MASRPRAATANGRGGSAHVTGRAAARQRALYIGAGARAAAAAGARRVRPPLPPRPRRAGAAGQRRELPDRPHRRQLWGERAQRGAEAGSAPPAPTPNDGKKKVIEVLLNSSCAFQSINLVSSANLRSLSIPPPGWLMKLLSSIGPTTDSQGQSQHDGHQLVLELDCQPLNKTAQVFTQTACKDDMGDCIRSLA
ncbi:uncharacterized protein LOC131586591 isoform X2 [Poecile atricapillus]|uniref:uncharacterized protein LOC131586591 isoform X2 n=1 Tax=Poecile atricapillus TaxID=48891 RepID=UPI0027390215|nr:uncharacterized protein LOC131586591 isoform X2 [Poecile atricapillus]